MLPLVLDSWAVMAWLKGQQPAAAQVRSILEAGERREHSLLMNIINIGEVFYLSAKARDLPYAQHVLDTLRPRIGIVSASDELVMQAAHLKARYPIAYTDAFAAATAMAHNAPLVTGDPELKIIGSATGLRLQWIGNPTT
jgi:predicted nucleic acid-binding protein